MTQFKWFFTYLNYFLHFNSCITAIKFGCTSMSSVQSYFYLLMCFRISSFSRHNFICKSSCLYFARILSGHALYSTLSFDFAKYLGFWCTISGEQLCIEQWQAFVAVRACRMFLFCHRRNYENSCSVWTTLIFIYDK